MLPKRQLTLDKVSLEIDLKKLFGKKVTDPALRRNIAESLIDIIIARTESGKGVNAAGSVVKLKSPYSQQYIDSPEFAAFGKSKSEINMKLTGSMLASTDLISDRADKLEIGIDNEDAPKAYNHMVGDTVPKREWLGLTAGDLEKVKKEYESDINADQPITVADIFSRSNLARLARIVGNSGSGVEFEP